jgi:DNA invertase Pin-like site-specific DNA recombinase
MKQSIDRQIENIKSQYPAAVIITETFTGTTTDRPAFNKLINSLHSGDMIVFDEVSRMSRNADEGFELYQELYNKGIELVFLKESTLNTENFRQTQQIATVGNEIADMYIDTTNKVLMILAKQQIKKAFESAQAEVDFLHQRTSEGVRRAQAMGKVVGRSAGAKVETKKAKAMKAKIMELSKDFNGNNTDVEVMKITGLARNTYYKYKAALKGGD